MDAWKRLPPDLRDMAETVFDAAALQERDDWVKSAQTLQGTLKTKGMVFTEPDMRRFRAELTKPASILKISEELATDYAANMSNE